MEAYISIMLLADISLFAILVSAFLAIIVISIY